MAAVDSPSINDIAARARYHGRIGLAEQVHLPQPREELQPTLFSSREAQKDHQGTIQAHHVVVCEPADS